MMVIDMLDEGTITFVERRNKTADDLQFIRERLEEAHPRCLQVHDFCSRNSSYKLHFGGINQNETIVEFYERKFGRFLRKRKPWRLLPKQARICLKKMVRDGEAKKIGQRNDTRYCWIKKSLRSTLLPAGEEFRFVQDFQFSYKVGYNTTVLFRDEKGHVLFSGSSSHHLVEVSFDIQKPEEVKKKISEDQPEYFNRVALYYFHNGRWDTALNLWQTALSLLPKEEDCEAKANYVGNIGMFWLYRGDLTKAEEKLLESLRIHEALGIPLGIANQHGTLGNIYLDQGDWDEAKKHYQKARDLYEEIGDEKGIAKCEMHLGIFHLERGNLLDAKANFKKSLEFFQRDGNWLSSSLSYGNLGDLCQSRGMWFQALENYKKSLEFAKKANYILGIGHANLSLSKVYTKLGELSKAEDHHKDAKVIYKDLDYPLGIASICTNEGLFSLSRGNLETSKRLFLEALAIHKKNGNKNLMANDWVNLGILSMRKNDYDAARSYFNKALPIHEDTGSSEGRASLYTNLGLVSAKLEEFEDAEEIYRKALEVDEQTGNRQGIGYDYGNLGNLFSKIGKLDAAKASHGKALLIHAEGGDFSSLVNDCCNLGDVYRKHEDYQQSLNHYLFALWLLDFVMYVDSSGLTPARKTLLENLAYLQQKVGDSLFLSSVNGFSVRVPTDTSISKGSIEMQSYQQSTVTSLPFQRIISNNLDSLDIEIDEQKFLDWKESLIDKTREMREFDSLEAPPFPIQRGEMLFSFKAKEFKERIQMWSALVRFGILLAFGVYCFLFFCCWSNSFVATAFLCFFTFVAMIQLIGLKRLKSFSLRIGVFSNGLEISFPITSSLKKYKYGFIPFTNVSEITQNHSGVLEIKRSGNLPSIPIPTYFSNQVLSVYERFKKRQISNQKENGIERDKRI